METREIPLSRTKLVFLLLGAMAFGVLGVWMLSLGDAEIAEQRSLSNPTLFRIIGGASTLFGVLGVAFSFRKLFDRRPGLVLSAEGITDNSSGVAAGLIPWSDITGFDVYQMQKQKFLVILVEDAEKYILRGNPLQRTLHRANLRMVGSPVSISSNTLKINFEELCALVESYRARYAPKT
jgi:hypothetical protein